MGIKIVDEKEWDVEPCEYCKKPYKMKEMTVEEPLGKFEVAERCPRCLRLLRIDIL